MSEVESFKSRLERTVKIQLSSEGRPYGRKDVLDGLLGAGVPRKAIEALGVRERNVEWEVTTHVVYGGRPQLPPSATGHLRGGRRGGLLMREKQGERNEKEKGKWRQGGAERGIAPMFARGIDATASWQLPTQSCHLVNRWKQDRR